MRKALSAYQYPQASACFIQSVGDDMEGIMRLAHSEAMLFKFGSGTGTDLSTLRSSHEKLSGGGKPSGPVNFMLGVRCHRQRREIGEGSKTRRARQDADPQVLAPRHPRIHRKCKTKEEKKAQSLIRSGYEANFNGEAYSSVMFQNANLSVRCTDSFLNAVEADDDWTTRAVTTGRPMEAFKARVLMDKIAEGTWLLRRPRPAIRRHHSAVAHLPQYRARSIHPRSLWQ